MKDGKLHSYVRMERWIVICTYGIVSCIHMHVYAFKCRYVCTKVCTVRTDCDHLYSETASLSLNDHVHQETMHLLYIACINQYLRMFYSLQNIARSLSVYGARNLYEIKIVESALQSLFPGVENLNHWRLRVVINILFSYMLFNGSTCSPYMCKLVPKV